MQVFIHGAFHKIGAKGRAFININGDWVRSSKTPGEIIEAIEIDAIETERERKLEEARAIKIEERKRKDRERIAKTRAYERKRKRILTPEQRDVANMHQRRRYAERKAAKAGELC